MKHRLLFFLVACIMAVSGFSAVSYSLNESFESGIPSSWSQEVVNASVGGAWVLDNQSTNPAGAYDGDKRVALRASQGNVGYCVRLVTPAIDLSSVMEPQLSFAYAQPRRGNSTNGYSCDTLSVYYRLSSTADWVLIRKYENYQNAWSLQTIDLPAVCRVAACQLAFEAKENGGYGVVLDRVQIFAKSQCVNAEITGVTLGANAARINWQSIPGRTFELIISTTAISDLSNYDTSLAVFYSNSITGTGQIVSNLAPSTHYYAYLRTDCDDNESGHTNWVATEFSTAIGIPYNPNLAAIPSSWMQKIGATATSVVGSSLTDNNTSYYKWNGTSNTTVFGVAHLYAQNYPSSPSWLITPSIDLSGISSGKSALLSFKLALTDGATSASEISSASSSNFYVYASMDEGATWSILRAITGEELTNTGHTFNILLDEFIDAGAISLAFVADAPSTSAYFHFANMSISESDGTCLGLHGLKANSTAHSINLSWSVIGTTNSAVAVLSSHANFSDSLEVKSVSASSVSFDGLNSGTTYYVSVRQDCEGSEALTISKTTAFAAPYANPFTTSSMPTHWTQYSGKTPTEVYASGLGTASTTSIWTLTNTMPSGMSGYAAKFNVYGTKKYWLASPIIYLDTENTYRLSFLVAFTKYNNCTTAPVWATKDNEFAVLISEDGGTTWDAADATTWRLDGAGDNDLNTIGIAPFSVLINLAAYKGKSVQVAIYQSCSTTSTDNDIFISNFEIQSYDASCGGVEHLKATSTSDEIAATWSAIGSNAVMAVLSKSATFADTLQTQSLTEGACTFSGLDANAKYYISVRQLCSEESSTLAVKTQCGAYALPYVEGFENYAANADPDCWTIIRAGGLYPCVVANVSYSIYSHEGTKAFTWGTSYSSSTQYKSFAVLPKMNAAINLLEMDFYIKSASTYYASDSLLVGVMTDPADTTTFVEVAAFDATSTSYALKHVDFSSYSGAGEYIAFVRIPVGEESSSYYSTTTYYAPFSIDDIKVGLIPTCNRMGAVELVSATPSSATLRFAATNASQYQVVVATESINPDSLAQVDATKIVYNDLVSSTQPVIPSLEGNTRYFAYVRGFCGGEDYSEWAAELRFKTLCTAISLADFGVESFLDSASVDCWTFGFNTPGTSAYSAYAKRDSVKAYGAYIKLSKEYVGTKNAAGIDTVYSDGAFAITPELDVEEIRNYQVSFNAATTSSAATNYKRLNVGVITDPTDLSSIQILKTIDLDYAADSTVIKSYSVSLANAAEDYLGRAIKYVIFQLNEPAKHDSTNYALIDNVTIELASTCEQIMEVKVDSVGVLGAKISWENAGASEYQVMVATVNSLRPDTISVPVSLDKVAENKALLSGLESNTKYFAYVRAICGAGDTAKWGNAISFRTSIAVPYLEPFSATTMNDGWQSKYYSAYASSLPDSIVAASFTDNSSCWATTAISLPTGMSGYAALIETESSSYSSTYAWLISPVIDMTENVNDFIELSFKMAGSNLYSSGYVALYVSVDGGAYKKAITWLSSGGTFDYNEITAAANTYVLSLTKYAGKTISIAIGTYQYKAYGASAPRLLIDDFDVHTYEAVCRGIESVSIVPAAESAKVQWEIEGTPVKAEVMISDTVNFFTHIDSVGVEDAFEHTFSGLTPNTTYYVRVRQLDCTDAEWKAIAFKTACTPVAAEELPWSEGFESMETGSSSSPAPECWNILNANDGTYPYIYVNTSSDYVKTGTKSLYFQSSSSRNGYAILPAFSTPLNELVIDFSYKHESISSSGKLDLGYMTNVANESSFVSIAEFARSTSWVTITGFMLDSIPDAVASSARLAFRYSSATNNNYYMGIDDITVRFIPGCPDMRGLAVDSIVSDSARIFADNLGAAGYHFVVATVEINLNDLSDADAAKIIFNDTIAGDTATFVTGLKPATNYVVYARSICDGDKVGAWSNPVSFKSACGVIAISEDEPWKESFESYAGGSSYYASYVLNDPCWINIHTASTSTYNYYYISTSTNGTNSTKQLCLPDMQSGNITLLATPIMTISEANAYEFQLDVYRNASGTSYPTEGVRIYASLSDTIDATAVELAFISRNKDQANGTVVPAESTIGWYTYKMTIPLQGDVRILIQGESKYGSSTYMDNFVVRQIPSCLPVTGLAAALKEGDGTVASLSWDKGEAASWKIQYATSADFANAVDTAISDSAFITLFGITPETPYYARVKVVCEGGAESEWSDAISFIPTNALSLVINDGALTNSYVPINGYNVDHLTLSQFVIPADSLAALQWDSIKQLTFYASDASIDWGAAQFEVYMAEVSSTTLSALVDWSSLAKVRNAGRLSVVDNKMVVSLDALYQYGGGNLLIGIKQIVSGSYKTSSWYGKTLTGASFGGYGTSVSQQNFLPKVGFAYLPGIAPACMKPIHLAVQLTQGDGTIAALNWESDSVAAWKVQYATADDFSNAVDTTISDTTHIELGGLIPETIYYARVKNVCDGGAESEWSNVIEFTPTNALSLTISDGTTTNSYVPIYGLYVDNLTLSQFIIPADSLVALQWDTIKQLTFYSSTASAPWPGAKFEVYMAEVPSTSISALTDWSALTKVMNAGSLSIADNKMVVSLDAPYQYSGGNLLIGFKQTVSGTYASCSWYGKTATGASFGGYGTSVSQQNFLPKVTFDYIHGVEPACGKPSGFVSSKVGAKSAEISFKASKAPEYELIMTTVAVNPDTIANVADSIIFRHDTVTVDTIAISGLEPSTDYYVYIRSVCEEISDVSEWVSTQFRTLCLAAVPYIENFDDVMDRKPVYAGTSSYTIPSCWDEGYDNKSYVSYIQDNTTSASYAFSGTSALRLYSYYYYSSYYGETKAASYVVLPELDAKLDTLQLTFKARAMNDGSSVSNYATSSYAHSVKIGTLTNPKDFSTFQLLDTHVLAEVSSTPSSADNYWEDVTVYLQGATGKYIVLVSDFGNKSNYVWIDDVEVSRAPDCLAPSLITVNAAARAADVAWSSIAKDFEVAIGASGFVLPTGADSIYIVSDTTGFHLADLEPATDYELYVRAVCGENVTSDWSSVASFTTSCLLPDFAEYNFDDASTRFVHHRDSVHEEEYDDWTGYTEVTADYGYDVYMENCWTTSGSTSESNSYYYGDTYQKTGYYPFVVDNEESYVYARSGSGALVFQYNSSKSKSPLVAAMAAMETLDRDSLQLEFWARQGYVSGSTMVGASTSDARMLRVGLMTNPNDLTTFVPLRTIKSDVLSGDPSEDPEGENYWRRYRINLAGTTAPFIAFVYDSTASNLFFVDDVRIRKMAACGEPDAPQITDITARTAIVRWTATAPEYQVALIHGSDTVKQVVAAFDTLKLENLAAATGYVVKLRAFCSANDSSEWSNPVAFTTDCEAIATLPWSENFDGVTGSSSEHVLPICWSHINTCTYESSYSHYKIYPTVYPDYSTYSTYSKSAPNALRFYSYYSSYTDYDPQDQYAILPEIADFSRARLKLAARKYDSSYDATFSVGVMTDPADASTFVAIGSYAPTCTKYEDIIVPLYNYSGSGKFIAIKMGAADATYSTRGLYVDDILIEEVDMNCLGVENLAVSEISANGAKLSFRFVDGLEHDAVVAISKEAAFDEATAILVDTVRADSSYIFNVALESQTSYYLYARQDCDANEWKSISFKTPYGIRYEAEFESTTIPSEWERYTGQVDNVLAGSAQLTSSTSGWYLISADTVVNAIHFRGNIYGGSWNNWVVSPLVSLAAPAGSDVQLHFDAGLTPYSSTNIDKRNTGIDDRFAVLVSTDNGATWNKLAEWNNTGSKLVYNDIPEHAKTFYVDLKDYVGQSVRVAFYGESSESNADNYFHFGNIVINYSLTESFQATICDGNDYIGSEHNNNFYIAAEDYQIGANTYEKYVTGPIGIGIPDTLFVLNLTVIASGAFEDSVVVCEGEHYNAILHGGQFDFDAVLGMQSRVMYVQNEYGCEDIVKLNITVLPKAESHVYDTIAQGDEYEWHDAKYISATTATFDTLSLTTGCDSTVYLHLYVTPKEEAISAVSAQSLLIAPNPVKAGEPIRILTSFSADELAEARIEIVSTSGALFYAQDGAEDPFVLPGIPVGGVYIVRIVVRDRIFISSLLVH
ncbi:MAG: fibronectin type III domain-containing protein [Paludibacteraceae bacterium]|nr:fibronectin type III domain-containing protein [Paludibacteraceae bacterium]